MEITFNPETRKILAELVVEAVTQAMSERRQEVQHSCICSDAISKSKHEADHEIIRRIGKFLDRVENAKWGFLMFVLAAIVSGGAYALWEGVKSVVRK